MNVAGAIGTPPPGRAASKSRGWLRALELTGPIAGQPERIFPNVIEELAQRFGDAPALLSEHESLTHRGLARRANQYAHWARAQGIRKGDVVCLLMPNRPQYMAVWIGVTAAGGVVALLNTHLTGAALAHCIDLVAPEHIIAAADLFDALESARPHLATRGRIWSSGANAQGLPRIDLEIDRYSDTVLAQAERAHLTIEDPALYIYTSGTTGLPKAAVVSHYRLMMWSHWFAGMMETRPEDRMYNCLPMYHSVGGTVAIGAVLVNGGSVVLREKFSARQFWDDVVSFDCTLFQYIGELCRYLLQSAPHPRETAHRLRLACGNGLRPDIWEAFKQRFKIPQILEFYAATEGNFSLFNLEGKPGAIGRIPSFLAHRFPAVLVKFDVERGEPVRGADGFCQRCAPDEVGEAIGKLADAQSSLGGRFEGYTKEQDSQRKILRDVFAPGDAWYRTGDLMRKDAQGFFYFVDRVGDTFRWKGENVSTCEVAEAISAFPGVAQANVYGVAIPGTDGRAGMAALATEQDIDLAALRNHLVDRLPAYARPVFLRLRRELAVTTTFKHKKADLVREGFDPNVIDDIVYFNDPERQAFVRLDAALHQRILTGQIKI
ncbi:MAG: long-chain-acyl-CoA synthetase [Xanthobacteraceae bacterium]